MDEIRKAAQELGMLIQDTSVYRDYERYRRELDQNPKLAQLLSNYEERAGILSIRQKSGETLAPFEIEEMRELSRMINEEDILMRYLRAREQYLELLSNVQEELKKIEDSGDGAE